MSQPHPKSAPRPIWQLFAILALAPATLLLATACGGDGEEEAGQTPTAEASPAGGESPAADESPVAGTTVLAPSGELQALSERWASTTGNVSYDFSTSSAGTTDSGSMTLYWKPPDWRMDLSTSGEGEVIMIATKGKTYFCSEGSCFSIDSPDSPLAPPLPFLGDFTEPGAISDSIAQEFAGVEIKKTTANIAGRAAGCYSTSSSVTGQEGQAEWCFGIDGLLLRFASSGGGAEFRLEATEAEREVSDSDFEPPFDVVEIPAGIPTP